MIDRCVIAWDTCGRRSFVFSRALSKYWLELGHGLEFFFSGPIRGAREQRCRVENPGSISRVWLGWSWKKRLFRAALHKGFDRRTIFNLMKFIDWVISLPEALDKQIKQALNEEEEAVVMTYIPSFVRDAHREGLREGKRVGERKGKLEGKRQFLSALLEQRFGTLPEWARLKVAKANEKTLDSWSRGILAEADSLERFLDLEP